MKNYIRNKVRRTLNEMIKGVENSHSESLCNTMTVNSYEEVINRITMAIGPQEKNPKKWARIKKPLELLKAANYDLNKEKHTNQFGKITIDNENMTGDSIPDKANTYWVMIQSELCK